MLFEKMRSGRKTHLDCMLLAAGRDQWLIRVISMWNWILSFPSSNWSLVQRFLDMFPCFTQYPNKQENLIIVRHFPGELSTTSLAISFHDRKMFTNLKIKSLDIKCSPLFHSDHNAEIFLIAHTNISKWDNGVHRGLNGEWWPISPLKSSTKRMLHIFNCLFSQRWQFKIQYLKIVYII